MGQKTFPTTREGNASYLSVCVPYLDTNSSRLTIAAPKIEALKELYGEESTTNTYLYYFTKWKNIETRTSVVTAYLKQYETQMQKMLSEIYNDIPASIWTEDDRKVLNRKTGLPHNPTHPVTPIAEKCFASPVVLGDGAIQVKCRSVEDSSRASKPEGCDAVEVAYRNDAPPVQAVDDASETVSKIKRYQIAGPNDGTTKIIFTKASFILRFDAEDAGNNVQFYVRWINTKHPELNGLWTGPYSVILS